MTTEFYDSARWGLIPEGADALLYGDGRYAVTAQQARRFRAVRWITVLGSPGCGAADFEPGNAVYEDAGRLRAWAEARLAGGYRARCYTSRSNLPEAHALLGGLGNVRWWIATLDGKQWTAGEIVADIAATERVRLEPETVWAVQWRGGMTAPYDESVLLSSW